MAFLVIYLPMHKKSPPNAVALDTTFFMVLTVLWGWLGSDRPFALGVFLCSCRQRQWVWSSKASLGLDIPTAARMWQAQDVALGWELSWAVSLRTSSSFFMCLWLLSLAIRSQAGSYGKAVKKQE